MAFNTFLFMEDLRYYANGKLLLTSEYFVLDGAKALALPTVFGQSMTVSTGATDKGKILWQSYTDTDEVWFEGAFDIEKALCLATNDMPTATMLLKIINAMTALQPDFWTKNNGANIQTKLTFPRHWGLGSSATLIYMLAQWAQINPYKLLEMTFGGSGYDIACAGINSPIVYQRHADTPTIQTIDFRPVFAANLYFVYLEKKQNSREGIAAYRSKSIDKHSIIEQLNQITQHIINASTLSVFEQNILQHEAIISENLAMPTVQSQYFTDYWGVIKSLGAWGGDFILATSQRSDDETKSYFHQKGYNTVLSYKEMILTAVK